MSVCTFFFVSCVFFLESTQVTFKSEIKKFNLKIQLWLQRSKLCKPALHHTYIILFEHDILWHEQYLDDDISDIYQPFSTSNCMEKVLQIASLAPWFRPSIEIECILCHFLWTLICHNIITIMQNMKEKYLFSVCGKTVLLWSEQPACMCAWVMQSAVEIA